MQISQMKAKSIRRIYRDLDEIFSSPIEGLGVCIPNSNNPFELRANILILDGIYKEVMLHLIISLPENYPINAPKIIIAPGHGFNHSLPRC